MNPQYLQQQPSQHYGPPQGHNYQGGYAGMHQGGPPPTSGPQVSNYTEEGSPSQRVGLAPLQGPQGNMRAPSYPGAAAPNGPAAPGIPSSFPGPASSSQLTNQISELNISGPPSGHNLGGFPPTKAATLGPPGSFPMLNGAVSPTPQQQFVNGSSGHGNSAWQGRGPPSQHAQTGQLGSAQPSIRGQFQSGSPATVGQMQSGAPSTEGQIQSGPPSRGSQMESRPASMGGQIHSRPSSTGGQMQSGPPSTGGQMQSGPPSTGGQMQSGPPSTGGQMQSGPPSTGGQMQSGPPSTGGQMQSRPPSTGGQMQSGPPSTGGQMHSGPPSTGGQMQSGPPFTVGPMQSGPPSMGGPMQSGPPSTGGSMQSGPPSTGGQIQSGPPSTGGQIQSGPPSTGGQIQSGPPSTRGQMQSGPPSTGGQIQSRPPSMGGQMQSGRPSTGQMQSGPPSTGGQLHSGPPHMRSQMQGEPPHMGGQFQGGPPHTGSQFQGRPPPMGGQLHGGPPHMGGQIQGGPPPMGGQMHGGPPPMGGQIQGGPPPMGGQIQGGPPPMGGQIQGGPSPMGGRMHGGPPPMGGQMHGGPPPMGGQVQGGPPPMGGQIQGGPPPMGGQMHGGPPPIGGQMGSGPPLMGGHGGPPQMSGPMLGSSPGYQQGPPSNNGYPQHPDVYPNNTGMGYQPAGQGYPPGPGPQQPIHPGLQSQPARRLDPDEMPSPIQVMKDDQRNRSGVFVTNQKGLVPPLVTTNFITQDQGNSSPRFIRSTMYNVPATIDMMKQTAVPFGLVVSPLARPAEKEFPPPIVQMGELGPVRCNRCKAYMCPFMQFMDGGRRFHCLFCKAATEVPAEYFQHLDHTGQRVDRYERPELVLGTYEFIATKDYCRNNTFPQPPAVVFLLDVSYNNVKSGMVHLLCSHIKDIIKLLPRDEGADKSTMKVGFITYNNTVHFYNIKGVLAQPQMMVVGDVQDMFMPLLEGFLCDPVESEAVIDSLMEQIPAMFADTRETETILAPAIQAGLEALKASNCAGKLLVFHSSLPIAEAPGKLKNRDDRKLLGTEKEKTVLVPQVNTYNNLGQECVGAGVGVDLFMFNNSYIDLATIGQVARLTGGEVYKYTYFQADLDGDRLISDIKRNVSRPIAFDAIMRVRTSTGVRATDFYGHFFMSNTTDMELGTIDCDKGVALEIKHDDKLTEEDGVYVQVALLYTSCGGQRRLRVINLGLKTCSQMADLYRSCDLDTVVNFFSKQAVFRLLETSPKPVKENLVNRCAQMLACYRKNCASPSSAGQLILPECMKLLPLYINCVLKSDAVSGGSDMTIDDRWFAMQAITIMDVPSSVVYFYPRLIPLHDIDVDSNEIPSPIRCSSEKLRDDGVYLLENGIYLFLWIGLNVGMEWVQNVFGVHSAAQIDIDRTELLEIDNPLSMRIRDLIEDIRIQRHRSMRLTLVRQRDKLELVFKHFLVEDRGLDGSVSYVDFLCHMHKEIRGLLS